ncbi:hypothetical protein EN925_15055 [Mesorhizobium sp. M7A.F.Ca.US.006.04.2.1]|uniref:hypothetical protein n=1 Tax=unclassified Mesorhizobium TaxID=325217 RepID=UPI000FCB92ED|nr:MULTISPECIES: hypothetical protein [unclassified Mesorhizobium]RUX73897.1 hypothetical protein EN990_19675 [Mesorhizobium sp. M7A.F.Ca.US.005.03.1.1]RUY18461.1 hypothetical protein EN991_04095 [Mesorhizobium sp. M7A.F.Ca.US.005.03.2.1]RVA90405.1 hypothetical protein EN925_15055 [Mesorhizobium sp. M7A.F.Ca.US.006.04.2.1]
MDKNALFLEDGSFAAPLFVKDIAEVPESHRDWYNPMPKGNTRGNYRLDDFYWMEVRLPFEQEVLRLEQQQAALTAKYEADIGREKQGRKEDKINATLLSTCEAAGIPEGLIEGAIAVLSKQTTFDVDDSYEFGGGVVIANSGGHLNTVETLVENFLDSDEGKAFRGKRRAAPSDDYFSNMITGMKERR